jgi:hypothetical protein
MSYSTDTLTALPFGAVIGGPLKAAIEAQALAARTTIEFIEKVGFEPPPSNNDIMADNNQPALGPVRNVTFTYEVTKADGTSDIATLTVPILTIVPIPYIRIDELTINFIAKIQEQQVNTNTVSREVVQGISSAASFKAGWWWGGGSVNYNASVSSKQNSTGTSSSKYQTEYTMNIHLRAVQDDMPAGLAKVLNILEASIKESRAVK